jgi:hypothetical protein
MHKTPSGATPFKVSKLENYYCFFFYFHLIWSFISLALAAAGWCCWLTLQLPFIKNKEKLTLFLLHQNDISVINYISVLEGIFRSLFFLSQIFDSLW